MIKKCQINLFIKKVEKLGKNRGKSEKCWFGNEMEKLKV
jgi:hypothetical protein